MAKRNPYIEAAKKDLPALDQNALTMKELCEIRNQSDKKVSKWVSGKIQSGEWERVNKKNDSRMVSAYRPLQKKK